MVLIAELRYSVTIPWKLLFVHGLTEQSVNEYSMFDHL